MSFNRLQTLTIYGRNPVIEALEDNSIEVTRVHLSDSNKPSADIKTILRLAKARDCEVKYHDKLGLSRISRNGKQDQGVAADIHCSNFNNADEIESGIYIVVDKIGNPQNLGMLARSVAAFGGKLIVSEEAGNTKISPLVVKASAGALFKCPIYKTDSLVNTCKDLKNKGFDVVYMDMKDGISLDEFECKDNTLFVLGNETDGVSDHVRIQCNRSIYIPMHNGVESLNVAVVGSIVSFLAS